MTAARHHAADDDAPGPDSESREGLAARSEQERSRLKRVMFNRRLVKFVGILIVLGLLYYSFFIVLPSEIDWSTVWADLRALTFSEVTALLVAGLLVMGALGWTSRASLPTLTLYQGIESSATSQLSAFAFPPPADMAIRFAMYRTYGFTDEQSAVAVLIAMVARYALTLFMPILGLAAVLVTGQGTRTWFWWFLALAIVYASLMWLIIRTVRSDSAAHATGRVLQRAVGRAMRAAQRTPPDDLETSVVKFGARTRGTLDSNGSSLVWSNLSWGISNVLVMALALRFSGLGHDEVSTASVVLATGLTMAINMLPIPGKDALAAGWIAGVLGVTAGTATSDLGTALLLYRLVTWIVPMPLGGITFFAWRYRVRRDKVTTVNDNEVSPSGSGSPS